MRVCVCALVCCKRDWDQGVTAEWEEESRSRTQDVWRGPNGVFDSAAEGQKEGKERRERVKKEGRKSRDPGGIRGLCIGK